MLNFVMTPIFVSKFSTAQYGIFTNLFAYASFINAVLAFGMETTYFRFLQRVEKENKPKVFNNTFIVTLVLASLFLLSMFVFAEQLASWFTVNKPEEYADYVSYIKLFGIILACDAIAIVPFATLRSEGRPLYYAFLKLLNILIFVGFSLFFIYILPHLSSNMKVFSWFQEGWIGNVFVANMIASVSTLVLLFPQIAKIKLRIDLPLVKTMLSYSFPMMIANVSFIINENIDKMMLPRLLPVGQGDSDLGIYGAVAKIAVFLSLVITAFRLGAEPFFFSYAKKDNARAVYAKILEYFTIVTVLCMVGITVNLDWLKYFIKSKDQIQQALFWSGLNVVPFLLFNYVLLGIYMNLSIWYKLSDQTRFGLYISGIGALITLVLNYFFIPMYSYVGAVAVTTVVYIVMISLSVYWGQKNYAIPYKFSKIGMYLLIGLILSLMSFFVLNSNFWTGNLLFILFIGFVVLSEKNIIKQMLNRK